MHPRGKIVSLLCDLTVLFYLFFYDNHKGTEDTEERKERVGRDSINLYSGYVLKIWEKESLPLRTVPELIYYQ